MKRWFRFILSTLCGLLLCPATCLAVCTSTLVPTPNILPASSSLAGVGGSNSADVWAVGTAGLDPLVEHFDGASWSIASSPSHRHRSGTLTAVSAVSPSDAWAVGASLGGDQRVYELSEHWNGNHWTVVPTFDDRHNYLSAVSSVPSDPTSVWAVGGAFQPNCRVPYGCNGPVAMFWNHRSHSWTETDATVNTLSAVLSAVVSVPGGKAWAVGSQDRMFGSCCRDLIEHWTGSKWIEVQGAVLGGGLNAVAALSNTDVWVVGSRDPRYRHGPLIEHWDGTRWRVVDFSFPLNTRLDSISELSPSDVWVGGEYSPETSTNAVLPVLAHFDGMTWSDVPTPGNGLQSSIAGLYQNSDGVFSVGAALPALQFRQITFAAFSHC